MDVEEPTETFTLENGMHFIYILTYKYTEEYLKQ